LLGENSSIWGKIIYMVGKSQVFEKREEALKSVKK